MSHISALEGGRDPGPHPARGIAIGPSLFWQAQIVGWLLFGVVYFLAILPQSDFPPAQLFGFKMVWAATGFGFSSALAALYRRLRLTERRLSVVISAVSVLSLLTAFAWVVGLGESARLMHGSAHMMYTRTTFPFVVSNHLFILLAWSGGYLTLVFWRKSQVEEQKSLKAVGLAREAQLEMLRYQLNPHFLFNAMTSVRALIGEHPEKARETVSHLSAFLRYTLGTRIGLAASVTEEMQIVRDYLAIEQVRFEERLCIEVTLDPGAAEERIPVFLLHTLVENAVKHGSPLGGRLSIVVRATVAEGRLRLEVANTGHLEPQEDGRTHFGLANLRDRLAASYPGRHSFELVQQGNWVRATIGIALSSSRRSSDA